MESLNHVATTINNILKASYSLSNAAELIVDLENQLVPVFKQLQETVMNLEKENASLKAELSAIKERTEEKPA